MRILVSLLLLAIVYSSSDCGPEQVLNKEGLCIKPYYIEGCFQYANTLTCAVCSYNYVLNKNGKCEYSPIVGKSCCKTRNIVSGQCEKCENGLFLQSGKCNQIRLVGCLTQDQKGVCTKCARTFYLEQGQCKVGVQNCAQYLTLQDTKICDQCTPGHSLVNNACLPNSILGCKDEVNGVCKDCFDPFLEKNDHCEVPNCQSHNEFGCVTCQCGFFLTSDRKCSQIAQGCIRYNRGVCTDCMQHFQLKGGVCDIQGCLKIDGIRCTQCQDGYVSTQLGCKLKNCLISKDGLCEVCASGYYHKQGLCVQSIKTTA